MFISQLKIYKEKENLSINIYIKNHPVFLFASPSSVAKETSVLKVSPSHWRRSGSSSMITRFANLMTIWNKFLKFYFVFNLRAHTQWIWKRTSKQWALFSFFFHYCWRSIHYCHVLLVKSFVFCCVRNRISVILSTVKGKIHWGIIVSVRK